MLQVVNRHHRVMYNEYGGRGTVMGNQYKDGIRDKNCDDYEVYFNDQILNPDSPISIKVQELVELSRNQEYVIACSCKPHRCHLDTWCNHVNKVIEEEVMATKQFVGKLAYLSNMYPVRIRINIQSIPYEFSCLESAFQALKSTNQEVHKAMESLNGYDAKAMGRRIKLRSDWNEKKLQFMDKLLFVKFENTVLKEKLINEPVENIVEHNTWNDVYWGKCNGKGLDHLGRLLREHKQRLMNK